MRKNLSIKVYKKIPREFEAEVRKLSEECFEERDRLKTPEQKAEVKDKYFSRPDRIKYILAFKNDDVVGRVIILKRKIMFDGREILLGGIGGVCVRREVRRQGIATEMMKIGMKILKDVNCDVAYLCADVSNPGMIKLYSSVGFTLLGKPHTYLGISGKRYTDTDGMIAKLNSQELFQKILESKEPLDIGRGNW